ncbi:MAG: hypothetical protein OXG68_09215 [Chloroflexi bacterium]|nr:hypothetical protein [Chloroflexota bacterium]MCY3917392.1 hypothetical protein [Chloroflexota bacterium]
MIETLMLIGLGIVFLYTIVLVSTVTYDVLTGRIKRLEGIAHKSNQAPLVEQRQDT